MYSPSGFSLMDACTAVMYAAQELMFSLLSAVLWLGNIQYRVKTADSVEVVPSEALSTAAALLRVPEERLVFALSKRKITAGLDTLRRACVVVLAT